MQRIKHSYAGFMQSVARLGPFARMASDAKARHPYGWRRWAASLLAIHDVERMVALGLPWWNVAATREVEDFLKTRPGARVFEYGAGASSIWLAQRVGSIVSVEHHAEWHERLKGDIASFDNARLWHRTIDGGAYTSAIADADGPFDLIVIDGRQRADCLVQACAHLKPGGIILFDDSGRRRYRRAIEDCGLPETRHFGRSYCVPYPDYSSILRG